MKVAIEYKQEWSVSADKKSDIDGLIWLYVRAGPMTGGVYITPEQAEELRDELTAALGAVKPVKVE
jgi:hypothetical protein